MIEIHHVSLTLSWTCCRVEPLVVENITYILENIQDIPDESIQGFLEYTLNKESIKTANLYAGYLLIKQGRERHKELMKEIFPYIQYMPGGNGFLDAENLKNYQPLDVFL